MQPRAGLDEECSLGLVRLDQRDRQAGLRDLQRQAGQAASGPNVDQPVAVGEVLQQDERVVDQVFGRTGNEPRPPGDHPREFTEFRISH